MANDFLVFDHVTKRFGSLTAVDDVSFSIKKGEFFSLLGPSGCGKTTLLRMLGGFERPDSGRIWLDGKDITDATPNNRRVHTVECALEPIEVLFGFFALLQCVAQNTHGSELFVDRFKIDHNIRDAQRIELCAFGFVFINAHIRKHQIGAFC